jgi:mRNA interferase MazF
VVVRHGEIWWADLGPPRGSAPALRRPVLIVQADAFNRSAIGSVIVATLTSNLARGDDPGNVRVPRAASGLPKESVVNVTQLASVDRSALAARTGRLSRHHLARVAEGLRTVLAL